jgi:hypothetical protein
MIISPSAISPYKIPTFQSGGGSGFDPDAQAFIDAVGADATISEYINTMFLRNERRQALQMAQTFILNYMLFTQWLQVMQAQ